MIMGKQPTRRRTAIELGILGIVVATGVIFDHLFPAEVVHQIVLGIVLICTPAPLLSVIYYSRSAWRTHTAGRALMTLWVSMSAVFLLVASNLVFGDYPGREVVRLVVYALLAYALWRLFYVLRTTQIAQSKVDRLTAQREGIHQ